MQIIPSSKSVVQTIYSYVNGDAVYKARTLYTHYEPALTYNDFEICGSITSNKHGEGIFEGVQNFLNQNPDFVFGDTIKNGGSNLKKEGIIIYPNPADENLNVKYHFSDGLTREIVVYDLIGRKVLTISLTPNANYVSTSISHLPSGPYTYSVHLNAHVMETGKLIIRR